MVAFEDVVKKYITSKLNSSVSSVGYEDINSYQCHIIKDSSENKEWVWVQHGLPIKWMIINYPEGIKVKYDRELKNIEMDASFADSLFTKP